MSDTKPSSSWLRTVQAVLWSFAGMRKSSASHEDMARLNPLVVLMVVGLIILVNWVVSQPMTLS